MFNHDPIIGYIFTTNNPKYPLVFHWKRLNLLLYGIFHPNRIVRESGFDPVTGCLRTQKGTVYKMIAYHKHHNGYHLTTNLSQNHWD